MSPRNDDDKKKLTCAGAVVTWRDPPPDELYATGKKSITDILADYALRVGPPRDFGG